MREIALHLLDIAENSVAADASMVILSVLEDFQTDRLLASVKDNGKGMNEEQLQRVTDPFYTSRTTRKVGLGIPLLKAAAEACNGFLHIDSTPGKGTRLSVEFKHSHIDRMPLGDLPGTILTLVIAYPKVRWIFDYQVVLPGQTERKSFHFDDQPIKEELEGISLSDPDVLSFLREYLEEGTKNVRSAIGELDLIRLGQS